MRAGSSTLIADSAIGSPALFQKFSKSAKTHFDFDRGQIAGLGQFDADQYLIAKLPR